MVVDSSQGDGYFNFVGMFNWKRWLQTFCVFLSSDVEKGDLEVRSAEAPEDCGELKCF